MHDRHGNIAVAYNITYCYIIGTPADAATSTGAITNGKKGFPIMTTDTIKNDYQLQQYAEAAARDIADEIKEHGGDAYDMAHEYADGSEHVIYYHKAHAICQNCDTSEGEEFISDTGEPEGGWSYDGFAVAIAYGELHSRILHALHKMGVE